VRHQTNHFVLPSNRENPYSFYKIFIIIKISVFFFFRLLGKEVFVFLTHRYCWTLFCRIGNRDQFTPQCTYLVFTVLPPFLTISDTSNEIKWLQLIRSLELSPYLKNTRAIVRWIENALGRLRVHGRPYKCRLSDIRGILFSNLVSKPTESFKQSTNSVINECAISGVFSPRDHRIYYTHQFSFAHIPFTFRCLQLYNQTVILRNIYTPSEVCPVLNR